MKLLFILLALVSSTAMASLRSVCEDNFQSRGYDVSDCQYSQIQQMFAPIQGRTEALSNRSVPGESREITKIRYFLSCISGIERDYNIHDWNAALCLNENVLSRWHSQSTQRCMENLSTRDSSSRLRENQEKLLVCSHRESAAQIADPFNTKCTYSGNAISLHEQGIIYNQQNGNMFGTYLAHSCENFVVLRTGFNLVMDISEGLENIVDDLVEEDSALDNSSREEHWIDEVPFVRRTNQARSE